MHETELPPIPAFPLMNVGIWRDCQNQDVHRYKPEGLFGNIKPFKTNGVLTLCLVLHSGSWHLLHADNIEPIKFELPKRQPAKVKKSKPARNPEIDYLDSIL